MSKFFSRWSWAPLPWDESWILVFGCGGFFVAVLPSKNTSRKNPRKHPRFSREFLDQNPLRENSALKGQSSGVGDRGEVQIRDKFRIFRGPEDDLRWTRAAAYFQTKYRHIRNHYLSNSRTFQDGNGNGILGEINSNDFQDGNWESMEMKVWLRTPRR